MGPTAPRGTFQDRVSPIAARRSWTNRRIRVAEIICQHFRTRPFVCGRTCPAPQIATTLDASNPEAPTRSMRRSRACTHIATGEVTSPGPGPTITPCVIPYCGRSFPKFTVDSWATLASSAMIIALSCWVDRSRPRNSGEAFSLGMIRSKTCGDEGVGGCSCLCFAPKA